MFSPALAGPHVLDIAIAREPGRTRLRGRFFGRRPLEPDPDNAGAGSYRLLSIVRPFLLALEDDMANPEPLGRLHVIIDARPGQRDANLRLVDEVLAGGAPVLQLRAKEMVDAALYELAVEIVDRCAAVGAACVLNDRADVAVAAGAAGVHVGQDDLPVAAARAVVGPLAAVGGTARGPELAAQHQAAGASYLGIGPIYATSSKRGLPNPLGPTVLSRVAAAVDIPLVAISGVTVERVAELLAAGAYGVAVIAAVANAADPRRATARFVDAIEAAIAMPGPSR